MAHILYQYSVGFGRKSMRSQALCFFSLSLSLSSSMSTAAQDGVNVLRHTINSSRSHGVITCNWPTLLIAVTNRWTCTCAPLSITLFGRKMEDLFHAPLNDRAIEQANSHWFETFDLFPGVHLRLFAVFCDFHPKFLWTFYYGPRTRARKIAFMISNGISSATTTTKNDPFISLPTPAAWLARNLLHLKSSASGVGAEFS